MPDSRELKRHGFNQKTIRGAKNAVGSSLALTDADVVNMICDDASLGPAAALLAAIEEVGAKVSVFIIERHATRPLLSLPDSFLASLRKSTVSIYTAHPRDNEGPHRQELCGLAAPLKLRHAHMIYVNDDVMMQGMLADYRRVAKLNPLVIKKLSRAGEIKLVSDVGTDVTVTLDPAEEWGSSAGVIEPGHWRNLPNGEIMTYPKSVDGIFVCDGIIPAHKQPNRMDVRMHPFHIELAKSRLVQITGGPGNMAADIVKALKAGKNMDRIGMFAVGTNFELLMPIGDPLQDLFVPGAYFSFGRGPAVGKRTNSWSSSGQQTFTTVKSTLLANGKPIIKDNRYDPELLAQTK